jgi:hypothetical protein
VKDGLLQLSASIVTCRLRFEMKGPNVLGYMESNPVSESSHIFEDNFWSDVPLDEGTNAIIPTKYHFSDRTLKRSHVVRPYKPPGDVLSKQSEVNCSLWMNMTQRHCILCSRTLSHDRELTRGLEFFVLDMMSSLISLERLRLRLLLSFRLL